MTVEISRPSEARHLRLSLKRGLARQAMARAARAQADHASIFSELFRMAPNRRGMERTVLRLRKAPGVVSAGIARGTVVVVLRTACAMVTRTEGVDAFTEDALIYTRMTVVREKRKEGTSISRASVSRHALERFIERGNCPLGPDVLDAVDAEAATLLGRAVRGDLIAHDGDDYLRARGAGVWAGSLDLTPPEPGWRTGREDACIPTFSARTFLGPDEMKPCVWLRWQDDPRLSMAV